jgi:tryptophan synthase alpha chain
VASKRMESLRQKMSSGRKALVAYFTVGYPTLEKSAEVFRALAKAGADAIEVGIPFSDPLADGPVIQAASHKAIEAGGSLKAGLAQIKDMRAAGIDIPLIVFSYYNPIYRMGLMNFAREASEAGADAVLVPDLPIEEAGLLNEAVSALGMGMVFLVAPTSTTQRMRAAQERSCGFVYAVSVTGVTGERKALPEHLAGFVSRSRNAGRLPVAVGFGVSGPEQAREVAGYADGVVIGTAFLRAADEGGAAAVGRLAADIRKALDGAN